MFSTLIGNTEVKETLCRLLHNGRVPGSLLFTGEQGIGKKLFALELAKALNCRNRQGSEACDECSACKRIARSSFPGFGKDDDDKTRLIWSEYADVAIARPFKNILRVDVMRELEREANFRPFEGKARVFIVEDADYLNDQAANALLKTLEEPADTSYLILTSSNPTALLPTIRSRCQIIQFAPITAADIEQFLIQERKFSVADAQLLARTSRGSLGRALNSDIEVYRERRGAMLRILKALLLSRDRAQLLRSAEELAAASDRDEFEQLLDILESLIRDGWALALGLSTDNIVNSDLIGELHEAAANLRSHSAASWLTQIEELRGELDVNVNRRIASDALVMGMMAA